MVPGAPAAEPAPLQVSLRELFGGFLRVGLSGFGGVLPWARRMLVDERRWLTEPEFTDVLSLSQLLPGPNIVNVAVAVGSRFQGARGALTAFMGLMLAPVAIVLVLASFYGHYVHQPAVHGLFRGVSAAAAGLVVAMAVKMALTYRQSLRAVLFATVTFVAVAVLRFSLIATLALVVPLSVAAAFGRRP